MSKVLILGAGASSPCGYPLGAALVDAITSELASPKESVLGRQLLDMRHTVEEIELFSAKLQASQMYSIDAFLAQRPEFLLIGKRCIVSILSRFEKAEHLLTVGDWYKYLWNKVSQKLVLPVL